MNRTGLRDRVDLIGSKFVGEVGEWEFYQVNDDRPLFKFVLKGDGAVQSNEYYESLEEAMVSAVGEKYTGDTAAGGWFMRMIGANA
jgi:hypothetical protein